MRAGGRPGRPSGGDSGNRERILAAAREEFAANGFRGTPLRSIAAHAGVDVSLLAHYFGSKDELFAAPLELPQRAVELLAGALRGDPAGAGERLARGYLSLWEDPGTGPQMQVLARSALGHEAAGATLRRLMGAAAADPGVAPLLRGRQEDLALAMSGLLGVAFNRYLVGHPGLVALDFDDLVARVGPSVQLHLAPRRRRRGRVVGASGMTPTSDDA